MSQAARRGLVISPNWIGDAVMAQPLLQLLKQSSPDMPIDVLAPAWVAPVWRAMAEVDTVIETPFRHGALQLKERWRLARQLKRRGYGHAWVLPNTLKFALVPFLAGIGQRIGYVGESRYFLLNVLHRDNRNSPRPMVSFYAALADAPRAEVKTPADLPRPRLQVPQHAIQEVREKAGIAPSARLVVFAPGAEFGSAKRWPPEHFAGLANRVRDADPQARVVLLGSGKDAEVTAEVIAHAPHALDLAGKTSLAEAIALLAAADAVVSNDSGLLHVASALNRPVLALYGPTDPQHAPPFSDIAFSMWLGIDCSPCKQRECPLGHHNCMRQMTPAMVWDTLQQVPALAPAKAWARAEGPAPTSG